MPPLEWGRKRTVIRKAATPSRGFDNLHSPQVRSHHLCSRPNERFSLSKATMDPVTACGLTSNVLHLVEISWRVVSTSRQIYRNGALPENRSTEEVTLDLQCVNSRLLKVLNQGDLESDWSEDDKALHALCQPCNRTATELVNRLNMIKVSKAIAAGKVSGRR